MKKVIFEKKPIIFSCFLIQNETRMNPEWIPNEIRTQKCALIGKIWSSLPGVNQGLINHNMSVRFKVEKDWTSWHNYKKDGIAIVPSILYSNAIEYYLNLRFNEKLLAAKPVVCP